MSGFNSRCGTFISVCDQPPRSTQPGHPFVGRRNEYQPKGSDALIAAGVWEILQEKVYNLQNTHTKLDELKQRLRTEWAKLVPVVIAAAICQWCR